MQECAKGQTTKQDCSNLLFAPAPRLCDVFGVPAAAAASHLSARVGPVIAQEARCSARRYCTVRPTEPQMTARDQGSEKHFKKDRIKSINPVAKDAKCLCHLGYRTPTRSCPSLAAAMLTADIGCPEAKLVVPSMGSTTHNQPGMMGTRNPWGWLVVLAARETLASLQLLNGASILRGLLGRWCRHTMLLKQGHES